MRIVKSSGLAKTGPPRPKRSEKNETIATWHTNRKLNIIGATQLPNAPLRTLPVVGQTVTPENSPRGLLRYEPHARALKGKTAMYEFRLFHHAYQVRVGPRYDRKGRLLGVRGTLSLVRGGRAKTPEGRHLGPSEMELQELLHMSRKRQRNSLTSTLRSLELAKAVADTARVNAEIRKDRATAAQEKALLAQLKAEGEERKARFLADASSLLDQSFDLTDILGRVGQLAVLRMADWFTIHFVSEGKLRRVVACHRDASQGARLKEAFPEEDDSGYLEAGYLEAGYLEAGYGKMAARNREELFSTMRPEDVLALAPSGERRRSLTKMSIQSLIRTPIGSHGRITGVMMVGSEDPGRLFNLQDLQMFRDLASRIALARESSVLYEEAQREIAMRKEIEARMRVLNAELERRVSDRTRLLEEATREANSFAYTVAHDLRAPLRAITGFCQALKEDYSPSIDAVGQDYLERTIAGARRMDDLIRDLLDYARINRAEIKRSFVDLDPVVDEVLSLMAVELQERNAEIRVEKPLGRVLAHGPVLAQVLTNLISNAAKFVAPGVRPSVQIRGESRKGQVRVLVQDNGIGIDPQHHERIFGIFERLNRSEDYAGTGIGLAIVRRAVERLGGTVGVESQPGQGSTFWVELSSA